MADSASNTFTARWTSAHDNYSVAEFAWDAVAEEARCDARDEVAATLRRARNGLLAVPAPTISEVIRKLEVWWAGTLWDDDYWAAIHRTVIGDLRRIQLLTDGVEAIEASGRSDEELAALAEAWRAALAELDALEQLLVEGPSPRWDGREGIEIVDAMDDAEGVLLQLPAPTLHGVRRKIELLWDIDRFDTIEDGGFYLQLVGDLNRLGSQVEREAGSAE